MLTQTRIFWYNYLVLDMFDVNGDDTNNIEDVTTVVIVLPDNKYDACSIDYKDLVIKKLN